VPTARVGGIDLYCELHGDPEAPALVFVNGLFQDTTAWSLHVRRFTDRYRCLVYDCRGQGRSAKPAGPYRIDQHAADLLGLLDAVGLRRPHVVGLSNGGAIAMTFAAKHRDRVARLVLVDTFAHADAALRTKLRSWKLALDAGGPSLRFEVSLPWNFSAAFLEVLERDQATLRTLRESALAFDPGTLHALIDGSSAHDARDLLSRIAAPTLVLAGEEDVLAPPWLSREIAAGITDARLRLLPGGHAMPVERLDEFCAVVRAFLEEA
jgi:3-oxoadipate enol-lactonase